jgi:hypothetical protein
MEALRKEIKPLLDDPGWGRSVAGARVSHGTRDSAWAGRWPVVAVSSPPSDGDEFSGKPDRKAVAPATLRLRSCPIQS